MIRPQNNGQQQIRQEAVVTHEVQHSPHTRLPNNAAANNSNQLDMQASMAAAEKEKAVFRCPDCSKSFKHASGIVSYDKEG